MSFSQKAHCSYSFIFLHEKLISKCSRTLKAYRSDIYRTFINFPYVFKIGEISPETQLTTITRMPSWLTGNANVLSSVETVLVHSLW